MNVTEHPDEDLRMLRIDKVLDLFPISKVSLYRLIKEGKFPSPMKLGATNVWSSAELRKWLDNSRSKSGGRRRSRREIDDLA
ncbi:MAG: AlpA family phage regulatory protein [Brucella anthropi]|jgi:prophage regulatory protein